ncbi:protein of unknown function [Clostridium beijerinckii]|nr:protein of unknown function [Clostridium beijerinckii]
MTEILSKHDSVMKRWIMIRFLWIIRALFQNIYGFYLLMYTCIVYILDNIFL